MSDQTRPRQSEPDRKLLAQARTAINHSRQLLAETKPLARGYRLRPVRNAVSLIEAESEWHVIVEEVDQRMITRSFRNEQYAVNYAEGQRVRLGLQTVTRI